MYLASYLALCSERAQKRGHTQKRGYAHIHADNNMIFSLYDYNFMHAGYSPLYLYNQNGETRMLTNAIVRSAVSSAGIQGANQTLLYAQRYNGFPGACVYGCGH